MSIDSEEDLIGLQRIGRIIALALREMTAKIQPGMTTAELDQIGAGVLLQYGARPAPQLVYKFPGVCCISLNDEATHGIPGERVICAGDLVNIDVSAELDGYFADTGATVPVPPVAPLQRKLCRCTRQALENAIAEARAGRRINQIGRSVELQAQRCGFTVIQDLTGHGVGRNIHEKPREILNYFEPRDQRRLTAGLVITIEPFLSTRANRVVTAPDGWTLKTPDGSLTAQYEHTVVITRGQPIIITAA